MLSAYVFAIKQLGVKSKIKYFSLVLLGATNSLLDIFAITSLIGIFNQTAHNNNTQNQIAITKSLPLNLPTENLRLAFIYIFLIFITKTSLSVFLNYNVAKFLRNQHVEFSRKLSNTYLNSNIGRLKEFTASQVGFILDHGSYFTVNMILTSFYSIASEIVPLIIVTLLIATSNTGLSLLLIFCVFAIFVAATQKFISKKVQELGKLANKGYFEGLRKTREIYNLLREVRMAGTEKYFKDSLNLSVFDEATGMSFQNFYSQIPKWILELVMISGLGVLIVSSETVIRNDSGTMTATLSIYLFVGLRILPAIIRIQGSFITIHNLSVHKELVSKFLVNLENSANISKSVEVLELEFIPKIELKNLSFGYTIDRDELFNNLNIEVKPYTFLAVTGGNGSGKSTLLDLMMGNILPTRGESLISDKPASVINAMFKGQISYVPQSVPIIQGDVIHNITLGYEYSVPEKELIQAYLEKFNLLHLGDIVSKKNRIFKEDDTGLSGGERQRIGLIRALYRRPKLLFLDEIDSAQDYESKAIIIDELRQLRGKMTIVMIAHTPELLEIATTKLNLTRSLEQ